MLYVDFQVVLNSQSARKLHSTPFHPRWKKILPLLHTACICFRHITRCAGICDTHQPSIRITPRNAIAMLSSSSFCSSRPCSRALGVHPPNMRADVNLMSYKTYYTLFDNKPKSMRSFVSRVSPSTGSPGVPTESQSTLAAENFFDTLKWDANGLVVAIAQHVDTGEVLMQAFADKNAIMETMQTGLATFYSRSRRGRWCKGETSGNYIKVLDVYLDCDKDSLIYVSEPIGPACHTNAPTCYFTQLVPNSDADQLALTTSGSHDSRQHSPMTTLYSLERTIQQRREEDENMKMSGAASTKPSWTAKLINNPDLLCKKVVEEAGELCQTLQENEGSERTASEAADLIYHAMVLLNVQGVSLEKVCAVLRARFGTSGIEEKASRKSGLGNET